MRVVKSFNQAEPAFPGWQNFGFLPGDPPLANEGLSGFQPSSYSLFIAKMLDLSHLHRNHLPQEWSWEIAFKSPGPVH